MSKFYDDVGFVTSVEDVEHPGKWVEQLRAEKYYGDVLTNVKRTTGSAKVIDDIVVSNRISIVGDPYAYENFHAIRYVKWMGSKWKVDSVEVQYPRLILSLGGVYNE